MNKIRIIKSPKNATTKSISSSSGNAKRYTKVKRGTESNTLEPKLLVEIKQIYKGDLEIRQRITKIWIFGK